MDVERAYLGFAFLGTLADDVFPNKYGWVLGFDCVQRDDFTPPMPNYANYFGEPMIYRTMNYVVGVLRVAAEKLCSMAQETSAQTNLYFLFRQFKCDALHSNGFKKDKCRFPKSCAFVQEDRGRISFSNYGLRSMIPFQNPAL